ncbi:MAG TPA: tRNA threonylcarbamoyladenosine dehydratase [Fibrobacteraceae bacterium]|nr:tRNA threonylcarbamoyladenosine dehydratase [Fibrobacteraceae bacterium]
MTVPAYLQRLAQMVGEETLEALSALRVAVFGVGGVGSWTAEALVRSGVGHLTLVDDDVVQISNVNRQLQATLLSLGEPKVEALADRLRTINPELCLDVYQTRFRATHPEAFDLSYFNSVVDAIDSLDDKVGLIIAAHSAGAKVFSSMGAGNKMDPTQIQSGSIWETRVCPLAKAVRQKLRAQNFSGNAQCVYSLEEPCPRRFSLEGPDEGRAHGSAVHITAVFGFYLAGMVIQNARPPTSS